MNLDLQQIADTWVQAQIIAEARQVQLDQAFQAISPDNQVLELDVTNRHYTRLVRELVGQQAWDWISWWCWECDYGRQSREFHINNVAYTTTDMTFLRFWELTCEQ